MLYEGFPQGLFDLLAGRIEAFACPAPTLWQLARETGVDDHIKVVDKPIAEISRAMAVRLDNRALLERLNNAIGIYVGTPAYQRVYAKWYCKPAPYWSERRIIAVAAVLVLIISALMAGWRYLSITRLNRELTETIVRRRKAEAALLKSEKQIRDIAAALGEGLYVLDDSGRVTFMNPEAERLLGWTEQELMDRNIHDVVHNRATDGTPLSFDACSIHNVIRTGERYVSHDEMFIRKDGTTFPVSVISVPLRENDQVTASVTAFRDISDLKKAEQEREQVIEELQRAVAEIKTLHGILPICANCKKIRDDKGAWHQLEIYIRDHTDADFTHGLCQDCARNLYPHLFEEKP